MKLKNFSKDDDGKTFIVKPIPNFNTLETPLGLIYTIKN